MTCEAALAVMDLYIDGELHGSVEREELERHLRSCASCLLHYREASSDSEAMARAIKSGVEKIRPPAGAKSALIARIKIQQPEQLPFRWRKYAAAALLIVVPALAIVLFRTGTAVDEREDLILQQRYAEFSALKHLQDEVRSALPAQKNDPLLSLVASAYLPRAEARTVLQQLDLTKESLKPDAALPEPVVIVKLARTTSKGGSESKLLFEQWSDGRVKVEHSIKNGDDLKTTTVEAEDWSMLAQQNQQLCRELEIIDGEGRLIAGLPIPSAPRLRREALAAMHGEKPPADMLRRLLILRTAPDVSSREQMERELKPSRLPDLQIAPKLPRKELKRLIAQLESETESAVEWRPGLAEELSYFMKLTQSTPSL